MCSSLGGRFSKDNDVVKGGGCGGVGEGVREVVK